MAFQVQNKTSFEKRAQELSPENTGKATQKCNNYLMLEDIWRLEGR